mgnify:CR=1 FL=1
MVARQLTVATHFRDSFLTTHRLTGNDGCASEKLYQLCDATVVPEYRDPVRRFMDVPTLAERLEKRRIYLHRIPHVRRKLALTFDLIDVLRDLNQKYHKKAFGIRLHGMRTRSGICS